MGRHISELAAARKLNTSLDNLRQLCRDGKLSQTMLNSGARVLKRDEVDALLESQKLSRLQGIHGKLVRDKKKLVYRRSIPENRETPSDELMEARRRIIELENLENEHIRIKAFSDRLIHSSIDGIQAFDRNFRYTLWNPGMERLTGISRLRTLGRCAFDLFPFLKEIGEDQYFCEVLEGKTVIAKERRYFIPESGREGYFEAYYSPLRNEAGGVIGGLAIVRDITERKQADEALLKAQQELEQRVIERTAELARMNEELKAEIKERKRMEQERVQILIREQEARKEVENANRLKDEFLATVSHELRTPLTAILGWIRLLNSGKLDSAVSTRALETIERNARAQSQIIDDLLDISSIITGKVGLNVQTLNIAPIVDSAVNTVRVAANAKEIYLVSVLDQDAGQISADPVRLQQIIWNLISNAVKFTPNGGRIDVKLERIDGEVQITIKDTGRGIRPDFLPFIFERFRQADSTLTRSQGGLGLGLAIVRHMVELHGGMVEAFSEGEGLGSTFTVRFPVEKDCPIEGDVEGLSSDLSGEEGVDGQFLNGLRVLVVDDDIDTGEMLSEILKQSGAMVKLAHSAAEAQRILTQTRTDVLISDISMPDEDGYDLIRKIRETESGTGFKLPALALTAHARVEDRIRALSAGYQQHVPKPVDPSELIATVASLAGWITR
jgi:PAS domain S-box-containing protein